MKTPREIAHEAASSAGGCDVCSIRIRSGECDMGDRVARAGMIEALRWAVNEADPDEVEAKLAALGEPVA